MTIKFRLRLAEAGMLCVAAMGVAAFAAFGSRLSVVAPLVSLLAAMAAGLALLHQRLRQGAEAAAGLRRISAEL
ncbi:hypothetical protein [Caulobacter sp. 17J80-11]|uniref:hypothetical protein n=1 Tax=Caulobacter sp. 17J80-11 TaxID=2763502 RepID=UPI001CA3B887|nr:hypothetical protein [Caulobacter sp. 17J80-11]